MSKKSTTKSQVITDIKELNIPIWGIVAFFAITTLIFFSNQLFGSSFFWEDFVEYIYPTQTLAAREFSKGLIPFWNNFVFSGMPFIADLQVGFFYPLNRISSLFLNSNGTLSIGFLQFLVIFHFFIAQVNTFFLAKYWKISNLSSIVTAISYSFSFIFVLHVIHPMMIYHLAWLPLVILMFDKSLTTKNVKYSIIGGFILGFSMLSGHPQTTLYQYLFLGIFFIWRFIFELKKSKETYSIINLVLSGILIVGISAGIFQIQYLQTKELANLSVRADMNYEKSSEGSLEIKQISTMVVPKVYGNINGSGKLETPFNLTLSDGKNAPHFYYWETGFYFGLVALIFGLFGAINNFKDEKVGFLIFIGLFSLFYAFGSNGFLHKIFYNFPLFNQFRNPARMLFFLIFGFSFLAGFGIDYFSREIKNNKAFLKLIIASAFPILIALLVSFGMFSSNLPEEFRTIINGYGNIALFISLSILCIGFLLNKNIINAPIAIILLILIVIIDSNLAGRDFNQSESNPETEYNLNPEMAKMFIPNLPGDIYRVNMRLYNPPYMALKRNQGYISNIMLIEGYNPLVLQKVNPPVKDIETLHDLLNVKYQLEIDSTKGMPFYAENTDRTKNAWLVNTFIKKNENEIENFMKNNNIDYTKTVILEKSPQIFIKNNNEPFQQEVVCTQYNSNSITYKVKSSENGLLCLSEIYYPSWNAYVNGKKTEILRANFSLRAIPIESGESTVELKFESKAYSTGRLITIVTLVLGLLFYAYLDIQDRRKRKLSDN